MNCVFKFINFLILEEENLLTNFLHPGPPLPLNWIFVNFPWIFNVYLSASSNELVGKNYLYTPIDKGLGTHLRCPCYTIGRGYGDVP